MSVPPAIVLDETRCRLGEGAAYDPVTDTAWWFDILGRRLFACALATRHVTIHELPVMASALGVLDDERQVLSTEDGIYIRRVDTGALTRIVTMGGAPGVRLRSNDGRVHPSGVFWVSMMGVAAEHGAGAIHALHRGALVTLFTGLTIPNAICFSADGATGYFADSHENRLHRVALDTLTGLPVGDPVVIAHASGPGVLDGAVIDADGLIWCARWGGGCVDVYAPDGSLMRRVPVPARQPSCPVFVGPGRDRLLVTSAYEGLSPAALDADPHHGRTFLLHPGAVGGPEPRVRLD